MWAYFCWLQISWVCRWILKTMSSCPGLTPMLHSTIDLTAGSVERSPLHQWKASRGGHPHFKEKTFSKSVNTFDNNHMQCLFIWWHLTTLKWTGAVRKHLTGDFLCAVLDLSGILCSLLIPEYSGIKRRGKPLPVLRNPGISFISFFFFSNFILFLNFT